MFDRIYLGESPSEEHCEQLGDNYNSQQARKECRALIHQIRRVCGEEPACAKLFISTNPHDAGTYYSVEVKFDCDDEEAAEYAYKCEENFPEFWDDDARKELGLALRGWSHV